ncbi:hypothetical protein HMPREF1556_01316 [Porphyromonas sp. oral taxon 278 str. W7784]|nr:hypothetical protein HMPREF1556_01316 [Porphyromonas sp. oral taxon 278 str. W7784]
MGFFPVESSPSRRGYGSSQIKPTVGRRCDPLWVVSTTYRRFFQRPTVGRFFAPQEGMKKPLRKYQDLRRGFLCLFVL